MKQLFALLLIFGVNTTNGQELTKKEFNEIFLESGKILDFILNANVDKIGELLDIMDLNNFEDFEKVFTEVQIPFNSSSEQTYAHPYYYLTESENILELTIPGVKLLERKEGEDYGRSDYYFVLKAHVVYNWKTEKVNFKNAGILTDEKDIERWWLGQWRGYLPNVKKVSDKFGFTPPPPPSPPKNLKS